MLDLVVSGYFCSYFDRQEHTERDLEEVLDSAGSEKLDCLLSDGVLLVV